MSLDAYWLDDGPEARIDADTLIANGYHYEHLGTDPAVFQPQLDVLKGDRGYSTQDEIGLKPETENLDVICAKFDKEHLHEDDEVRFVLEGDGIFDLRSTDDRWMRVIVHPGDLIVVPKDKHHRFLLTESKRIQCLRLFKDEAGWVPVYR